MELIGFGILGAIVAGSTLMGFIGVRRANKTAQLVERLKQYHPIYLSDRWDTVRYFVDDVVRTKPNWQRCTLLITHKRLAVYAHVPDDPETAQPLFTVQPHELRGFWRPVKYMPGENELWIHAEQKSRWRILKFTLYHHEMQALIRAMKEIATPEQTKAYRRRRPYIHRDLTTAYPAHQTLTGAWELGKPVQLYLMPLYLVVIEKGHVLENEQVLETIDLSIIQEIGALKRMEGGDPAGLMRFFVDNELRAFALKDYQVWANDLAEAAKRTLEEPVTRKRKSKDDDDDFDEDE